MLGQSKVTVVQNKIKSVKGQIAAAVKSANLIFQQALVKVNRAIESISKKKKELLGFKTTLGLEVDKINVKITGLRKDISGIEANYSVINENITDLEKAVKELEAQRDKIKEFIVKV